YENPGPAGGRWQEHLIWPSACNETPQFVDLFGTGQKVLVMASQPEGQMDWFAPGPDPTQPWVPHPISEKSSPGNIIPGTEPFSHGLGVGDITTGPAPFSPGRGGGDINGAGRLDVMTTAGWWEQPVQVNDTPWVFHPADLGPDCADMYAFDVNGDGQADVLSSSAHDYGIWW